MNVSIEEISSCRKRLKIEVPANRVNDAFEKVTDDFQRAVRIPGFRPGKAPRSVVQKKYLKDIEEELQRTLVPEAYREAVQSKNLRVVSAPEIEDLSFKRGLSLSFSTIVDLAPDFQLPNYKGLPVKKVETAVTDEDVNQALNTIREQQAEFVDAPVRPLQLEDFAVISYQGTVEGKPVAEWVPQAKNLGENPQFWLWMKPDMFLPKFVDQIVGMNIGDRREVKIDFPEDFGQKVLAGKSGVYQVELKEIKTKKLPELTEEYAQEIAKMSLEDLKAELRKNLESNKKFQAEQEQKSEIVKQLVGSVNFELPESLVEAETRETIYNIVSENQARGIPSAMIEEKKQEIFENAAKNAKDMVKMNFLVQRIADEEKITVTNDELGQRIAIMAQQQGVPFEKLLEKIQKNNDIPSIQRRILMQKVLDFLLQQAKVE